VKVTASMGKKKRREEESGELILPTEEGQVICVVTEMIGANYVKVLCMDGKERRARIPGRMRRRVWINPKDVVLLGIWEFDDDYVSTSPVGFCHK